MFLPFSTFLFSTIVCPKAQGYIERFSASDEGIIKWLSDMTHFLGFQEGWAVYAESPLIAKDTDAYKGRPLLKYGNLKWQVMKCVSVFTLQLVLLAGIAWPRLYFSY